MSENYSSARHKMFVTYARNRSKYRQWLREREHYISGYKARPLCQHGTSRERLLAVSKKLLEEFPKVSFIEAYERIGGKRELLWELGHWGSPYDPYWAENLEKWRIYVRLRLFPGEINDALMHTDLWAEKLMVSVDAVEKYIPEILEDIGNGVVW